MPAGTDRIRWLSDGVVLVLLVVLFWYIGSSAFHAGFPPQVLLPQEKACVIREDVCGIVATLHATSVKTFDLSPHLTPEVRQRVAELGYPLHVAKDALVRVELCAATKPGDRVLLRVKDAKRPENGSADLCVIDRR